MLDPAASLVLTLALVPVVVWCAVCLLRRARHRGDDPVPADVEGCHAGMGVAMVVMLWVPLSAAWAWAGACVFAAMTFWCVRRVRIDGVRAWYRRLGVMAVAMAAMLVPAGAASATGRGAPDMGMDMGGSSMDMAGAPALATAGGRGSAMLLSGAGAMVVAVAVAAAGLVALRSSARPSPSATRLSNCCEAVAAAAMTVMALALL